MTGKREFIAQVSSPMGFLKVLETLPQQSQLLAINYHRVGDQGATEFDPEVFSTDPERLATQISYFKRHYTLLEPAEALDIIGGKAKPRGLSILLTFDDGYRDNLNLAVPVLKALGAKAMFFLVSSFLDDPHQVPWWDKIAWMTRRSVGKTIHLSQPEPLSVPVSADQIDHAIKTILRQFRKADVDEARFFADLEATAGRCDPQALVPLLMDWTDARALHDAGMTIGVHTHNHPILSRLSYAGQIDEMTTCKRKLTNKLGVSADTIAYPVGSKSAFTDETKRAARDAGFKAGFSFYGGTNKPGRMDRFDVKRVSFPNYASHARMRTATGLIAASGRVWF